MIDAEMRQQWVIGETSDLLCTALVTFLLFAAVASQAREEVQPAPVPAHHAAAAMPPAYLGIRPRARPWYGNTEGDWAARLGQCLHAPMRTVDDLRGFAHGLTPQADFMRMDPYFLVTVSSSGDCRRAGSRVIRDRPKAGMMNIYNVQSGSFTELYVVELAQKARSPRLFAYRTK